MSLGVNQINYLEDGISLVLIKLIILKMEWVKCQSNLLSGRWNEFIVN